MKKRFIPVFGLFTCLFPFIVNAEVKTCSDKLEQIKSTVASADTWGNIRNSDGSLKKESSNLIVIGLEANKGKFFTLTTVPKVLLKDSSDKEYCKTKLKDSTSSPIVFGPRFFKSLDELQSWVGDLSKGSGEDGEKLYEICDKSCSPSYAYMIKEDLGNKKFEANVSILCGLPRDKGDNKYSLELWCGEKTY